jgi:hypothetical protein
VHQEIHRGSPQNARIKIGLIASFSGRFADSGAQIENGIKTYLEQHGDTVAGKKIEILTRDTTGRRRTSPSAWRRSWPCATRWASWSGSGSRPKRSPWRQSRPRAGRR